MFPLGHGICSNTNNIIDPLYSTKTHNLYGIRMVAIYTLQISNLFSTLVKDKALITSYIHYNCRYYLLFQVYLITRINAFQIALKNLFCNNFLSKGFCNAIGNKQMDFKQCLQHLYKNKRRTRFQGFFG